MTTTLQTKNYNARRKMIVALITIMRDENTNLLTASAIARDDISDAVDVIRETHEKPCEELHKYIKGERCYRCGTQVR